MRGTRLASVFAVLCILVVGWIGQVGAQQPVSTGRPVDPQADSEDRGYDYDAVCVFAEVVAGYVLPALDNRFFRQSKGLKKLPATSKAAWYRDAYGYVGDGVTGVILRKDSDAFFQSFRIEGKRFPKALRSQQHLLDLLDWRDDPGNADDVPLGCEQWTVRLHFNGNTLTFGEFFDARLSYE